MSTSELHRLNLFTCNISYLPIINDYIVITKLGLKQKQWSVNANFALDSNQNEKCMERYSIFCLSLVFPAHILENIKH